MEFDRALSALGSEYDPDILRVANEPHSTQELSKTLDTLIATCCRRTEELTAAGFLELHDRVSFDEHRRTDVYRREVGEIVVRFEDDDYAISVVERPEVKNKLDGVWRRTTQS